MNKINIANSAKNATLNALQACELRLVTPSTLGGQGP